MTTTVPLALTEEQVEALRARHPYAADLSWLPGSVRSDGWLIANVHFLELERQRSADAMRDLMREVDVERVETVEQALDLIELALAVFAPPEGFAGQVKRETPGTIRIENAECPVYRAFEDASWHTVTACPSWHRRRGSDRGAGRAGLGQRGGREEVGRRGLLLRDRRAGAGAVTA